MKEYKKMAASWGRSFIAACLACYMAGVSDPKLIFNAGLAAILPVLLRYVNPKDDSYGVTK